MNIPAYIRLMRPEQWIKNLFVFAPMFFSQQMGCDRLWITESICFLAFCLASGAVYCFNDLIDADADRKHPLKCHRPIASGMVTKSQALILYALLSSLAILLTYVACHSMVPLLLVCSYLVINIAYSLVLKRIVIIDVLCVASGFIIRLWAGAAAGDIWLSPWTLTMVFLLSTILALGKRRGDNSRYYNPRLLRIFMGGLCAITLIGYLIFCLSPSEIDYYNCQWLWITAIFVGIGLIRYSLIAIKGRMGADPTKLVVHDPWICLAVIGWLISFTAIIYCK